MKFIVKSLQKIHHKITSKKNIKKSDVETFVFISQNQLFTNQVHKASPKREILLNVFDSEFYDMNTFKCASKNIFNPNVSY